MIPLQTKIADTAPYGNFASVTSRVSSLLHYACWNGWYDVSRKLVDKYQCDPHRGDTPYACKEGSTDIVKFLVVDHHCDPACPGEDGKTPLHWACGSGKLSSFLWRSATVILE